MLNIERVLIFDIICNLYRYGWAPLSTPILKCKGTFKGQDNNWQNPGDLVVFKHCLDWMEVNAIYKTDISHLI